MVAKPFSRPARFGRYPNGKNQRDGFGYDASGNLTQDDKYSYAYNATGQQVSSLHLTQFTQNGYDGDGLRGLKSENDVDTYYFRSSVLGGAVLAEIDGSGNWTKGYVYQGSQLLATQSGGQVNWVHEDAITKSQRVTDINGNVITNGVVELDPWGANTSKSSSSSAFQPHQISGYTRDLNGDQDAMARRYSVSNRFSPHRSIQRQLRRVQPAIG